MLGREVELPVPRTTAAAAAAAAIGPYAVRGIAGKEGTGISGALGLHRKLEIKGSFHFLLQNTGLTHTYWLSAPQGTLKDDNREVCSPEFISVLLYSQCPGECTSHALSSPHPRAAKGMVWKS